MGKYSDLLNVAPPAKEVAPAEPKGSRYSMLLDVAPPPSPVENGVTGVPSYLLPNNPTSWAATEHGNIDTGHRPRVKNADGSVSSVRSMSFEDNGQEILVPTVSEDGRIMSDDEAIRQYRKTGRHLGKFRTPDDATAFAEQLHKDQERLTTPTPQPQPTEPTRSVGDRIKTSFENLGNTFKGGALAIQEAATHPIDTVTDPAKMSAFARGIDDMTTLGYGQKLADYAHTKDLPLIGKWDGIAPTSEEERIERGSNFRSLGNLTGVILPGATTSIAKAGAATAGKLIKGAGTLAKTGRTALSYGATVPLQAGLSANAEGHRLETAVDAATDPANLTLAITPQAIAKGLNKAGKRLGPELAKENLTRQIITDAAEGEGRNGGSTTTAKKLLAADKKDIANLVIKDSELHKTLGKDAVKALPIVENRMKKAGRQLGPHYEVIDEATKEHLGSQRAPQILNDEGFVLQEAGGGGFKTQELVNALDKKIAALDSQPGNSVYTDVFRAVRDDVANKWNKSTTAIDKGLITGEVVDLSKAVTPTQELRNFVTKWQNKAQNVINPLNPGEATQVKADVSRFLKEYLDGHLDEVANKSGDSVKNAVSSIRKLNTKYSALSTIKKALEQREWKESNGSTSGKGHIDTLLTGGSNVGAIGALMHGNIPLALGIVGANAARPLIAKGAKNFTRNINRRLAAGHSETLLGAAGDKLVKEVEPFSRRTRGTQNAANAREDEDRKDDMLASLVLSAESGDSASEAKLSRLELHSPIVASRIATLRRRFLNDVIGNINVTGSNK